MEKKLDFEAAKQKVAEIYGEKNWTSVCLDISSPDWLYARAAEILAQSWANKAVQEDRENLASLIQLEELEFDGGVFAPVVDEKIVLNRPLPYLTK